MPTRIGSGAGRCFPAQARRVKTSGFTLVELLVVIVILGLLAGLTVPVVRNAKTKADSAASLAKMKGVAAGVLAFAGQNNGLMPWVYGNAGSDYVFPDSIKNAPDGTVGKDFPENTSGGWIWALVNNLGMTPSDFVTPRSSKVPRVGGKEGRGAFPAFTLNFNLSLYRHTDPRRGESIEIPWSRLSRYSAPSRTIMLSEISFQGDELHLREWAWYNAWGTIGIRAATQNKRDGISKSPFVFFDGHGEMLAPDETIKNNTSRWIDPAWYPNDAYNSEREASQDLKKFL